MDRYVTEKAHYDLLQQFLELRGECVQLGIQIRELEEQNDFLMRQLITLREVKK